jgi:hypothetical protein
MPATSGAIKREGGKVGSDERDKAILGKMELSSRRVLFCLSDYKLIGLLYRTLNNRHKPLLMEGL